MFIHTLPTTRPISFADHLHAPRLALEVTQTTERRSKVQGVLQSIKEQEPASRATTSQPGQDTDAAPPLLTQKDWLKVVQAVEEYIPSLAAISRCLKTDDVLAQGELIFTWKETLSASHAKVALPGIHGELMHAILLDAKASCNLAATLVAGLGQYETTQATTLSQEERKRKEDRLKFGADLLCRAAGMFEFAGNEVIREWENEVGNARLTQLGRSAEWTREMCFALARLAQAEAEALAIRKLLSPTACYQTATGTAAPPLPSGHPSPSLLSKLYVNVADQLESALSLAQTACGAVGVRSDALADIGSSASDMNKRPSSVGLRARLTARIGGGKGQIGGWEESVRTGKLSKGFVKYLTKSIAIYQTHAYLWLGVDRGERGQYGEALSFLRLAKEEMEGLQSTRRLALHHRDERKREERRHFTLQRDAVLQTVEAWSRSYTQLNDTVGFQPIPSTASLSSQIPAGRGATAIKPYTLSSPAFGPGSNGFVSEGMDRMRGMGETDRWEGQAAKTEGEKEYAGQGAYY